MSQPETTACLSDLPRAGAQRKSGRSKLVYDGAQAAQVLNITEPSCVDCRHAGCPTPGKCAEIDRLRAALLSVQRSAFDAGYDAARDGRPRLDAYAEWSNQ